MLVRLSTQYTRDAVSYVIRPRLKLHLHRQEY